MPIWRERPTREPARSRRGVRRPTGARAGAAVFAAALCGLLAVGWLGWSALRSSGAFAVDRVVVRGATGPLAVQVRRAALQAVDGESLLALSSDRVVQLLRTIP